MDAQGRKRRRRLRRSALVSLAGHVLVVLAVVFLWNLPIAKRDVRRGEPLMVELQNPDERSPAGNPAMREPGPAAPPVVARPTPKRDVVPPAPARPAPRPTPASRPAPEPPRVTSAPPVPPAETRAPSPTPAPPAKPPESAPTRPTSPSTSASSPSRANPPAESSRVASVPTPDLRSLKGGGAGGRGGGRGGIEGEPIPLDSEDPKFNEYLDRLRRMIKAKWDYPCVKNEGKRGECEYKSAQLIVEFGILKDGRLQFVDVRRTAGPGLDVYDDYAVNAIKLASPFPPPPPAILAAMKSGSTGIAIAGHFVYHLQLSFGSLLR